MSFCTGAFALAEAGLLDGRPATTHWAHADAFRQRYPLVQLDPSVLYVDDGDVLTSAGAAAAIDLAMHVVRRDFGAEVATRLARDLVVSPHRRGGQAQFIQAPVGPPEECGDGLGAALEWASAHLDEELSVAALAGVALMSPRHFARQFRATTGTTPHQWILTQRLGLAQRLLETTDHERGAGRGAERVRERRGAAPALPAVGRDEPDRLPPDVPVRRPLTGCVRRVARRGRAPACGGPGRRATRGPTRGRRRAWSR